MVESDITGEESPSGQSFLEMSWPYAAFLFFVAGYSYLFLADGFNATDEGYLQSLAQRIVDGELPYADFYFLRTPLSLYLQAAFIYLFGSSYTVLAARAFWTVQTVAIAFVLVPVYRRFVSRCELLILLCSTWVVSSQLIAFPWYSYDAVFFALIALVLYHRRWFGLTGVAIFLAALSKQNYLVFLPVFVALTWLLQTRYRRTLLSLAGVLKIILGFIVPTICYVGYLELWGGGLDTFVRNVFVLPGKTSEVSAVFAIFQNHHVAFAFSLPALGGVLLWYYFRRERIWLVIPAALLTAGAGWLISRHFMFYAYALVTLNYGLLIHVLVITWRNKELQNTTLFRWLLPLIPFCIALQYMAAFNYVGLTFGYMGAAPGLIVAWLLWREQSPSPYRKTVAMAFLLVIMGTGLYYKYSNVSRDAPRKFLYTEFASAKLSGIQSTRRNVGQIDHLVATVEKYTEPGDYILVFPDMPTLYYLTDRRNPTPIGWYVLLEFTSEMMQESLAQLEKNRPRLVLLQSYPESDYRRKGDQLDYLRINRYRPFLMWLLANYKMLEMVGDVAIFVPGSPVADQKGN